MVVIDWLSGAVSITRLLSFFKRIYDKFSVKGIVDKPIENIASRFVSIFENHGIHRNQIPRFLGHDLQVADVASDESLLPKLTEEILSHVCDLFGIRREWLDCADDKIFYVEDFYKDIPAFELFVTRLIDKAGGAANIDAVLFVSNDRSTNENAVIVFSIPVRILDGNMIYRYYFCQCHRFSYWRAKAYIAAFVAIMWKHNIYIKGREIDTDDIALYASGYHFIDSIYKGKHWYPEDICIKPEVFLDRVNPEISNYGSISGLALWVELADYGYMDTGIKPVPKEDFKSALQIQEDKQGGRLITFIECLLDRLVKSKELH